MSIIMRRNNPYFVRKTHRFLGVFIGLQFLFWTISGLYFSWTDIDVIYRLFPSRSYVMLKSSGELLDFSKLDSSANIFTFWFVYN